MKIDFTKNWEARVGTYNDYPIILNKEDAADLYDTAFYGSSWAYAETTEKVDTAFSNGETVTITPDPWPVEDDENGKPITEYHLNAKELIEGLKKFFTTESVNDDIMEQVLHFDFKLGAWTLEMADIDGNMADYMIQYAIFGKPTLC